MGENRPGELSINGRARKAMPDHGDGITAIRGDDPEDIGALSACQAFFGDTDSQETLSGKSKETLSHRCHSSSLTPSARAARPAHGDFTAQH